MKRKNFAFAALGLIMFLLNACSGNLTPTLVYAIPSATSENLATSTPISTNTVAPTASLISAVPTYTPGGPFPTGRYQPEHVLYISELEFREDGTFRYVLDPQTGGGAVRGTYVVDSDKIVLNESETGPCAGYPGTYSWSFDGNVLFLKAIEDECPLPHKLPLQRGWIKQS